MTIQVKEITSRTIELETPAFFIQGNFIVKVVDDKKIIKVHKAMISIYESSDYSFENELQDLISTGKTTTDAAFMNAYNKCMATINSLVNNATPCITQQA